MQHRLLKNYNSSGILGHDLSRGLNAAFSAAAAPSDEAFSAISIGDTARGTFIDYIILFKSCAQKIRQPETIILKLISAKPILILKVV